MAAMLKALARAEHKHFVKLETIDAARCPP